MKDTNLKKNFIWNTLGVLTLSLTSFVYSLILVRLCNLSVSGVWSYTFAIACTSVTLASFGGRTFQVTDVRQELSTYTYIFARYFTVSVTFILILIFTFIKGFSLSKSFILIFLCLFKFCEELSDVYYGILQKHDKLYIVGKSMFFKSIFNMLLFFLGIYLFQSLLVAVIFILVNNFMFFYFYDRKRALMLEKVDKKICLQMMKIYLKNNLIICLTLFLATYLVNCPKYVMGNLLNDEQQGIYNLLALPATAVTLIGSFIINPLLVGISEDYEHCRIKNIKRTCFKIVGILLLFGILILGGGYLLGIPVMKLVYDFDLALYLSDFMLMIIGCTFYTISSVLSLILISTRKLMSQLIFNIVLTMFAYLLCYFLIQNYVIHGGVLAYLIVMFIRSFVYILMIVFMKEKKNEEKKSLTSVS